MQRLGTPTVPQKLQQKEIKHQLDEKKYPLHIQKF
tara:strand:- start:166 stop:270 length:105 start_codon:yes stop_codon:yes gene_type:complete